MAPDTTQADKKSCRRAWEFPSRFQRELQAPHSIRIGEALSRGADTVALNPLAGPLAPWLDDYFDRTGLNIRLTLDDVPPAPQAAGGYVIVRKYAATEPLRFIEHQSLGRGGGGV